MRSVAAACALLALSCGEVPPPAASGGSDEGTGSETRACQSDRDCPGGEICSFGLCGQRPSCTRDADCPRGYRCNLFAAACVEDPDAGTQPVGAGSTGGGTEDGGTGPADSGGDDGATDIAAFDGGGPECDDDSDCSPPQEVCSYGDCVPGCGVTGCAYGETCRSDGRCALAAAGGGSGGTDGGGSPPASDGGTSGGGTAGGGSPSFGAGDLGASCGRDLDCQSEYCYLPPGEASGWCTQLCSASWQCAPDFRCGQDARYPDTMFCFHESLFGVDVVDSEMGSPCTSGAQCKSGLCLGNNQCSDTCGTNQDCDTGWSCIASFQTLSSALPFCIPDAALAAKTSTTGARCSSKCRSLVCDGEDLFCADLCCTSRDCPLGAVCLSMRLSGIWPDNPGFADNFLKACYVTGYTVPTAQMGDACSLQRADECRGQCVDFGDGKGPYCTDTCCVQEDCPDGWRCQAFAGQASTVQYCVKP